MPILVSDAELKSHALDCAEQIEAILQRIAEAPDAEIAPYMNCLEIAMRSGGALPVGLDAIPRHGEAKDILKRLGVRPLAILKFDWNWWSRPAQLAPAGDWKVLLIQAGRGFGKTRSSVEWLRQCKRYCQRMAIIAETAADARDVLIDGPSGLRGNAPPWDRPEFEVSKRRVTWRNGAYASVYAGEEPGQLRGPGFSAAIIDELAKYRYANEVWNQLNFTLREKVKEGPEPRVLIATTPRPIPLIKTIRNDPRTITVRGSSFDNRDNLARSFIDQMEAMKNTSMGRQEIMGEHLDEVHGAMWTRQLIDDTRVIDDPGPDFWKQTVIGLDPQAGRGASSTGIVAASRGADGHGYVRADASGELSTAEWARRAVQLYHELDADYIAAEINQGGDMVSRVIEAEDKTVQVVKVRASQGKQARAEPVVMLWETGRAHILGNFGPLEDQLVSWVPSSGEASPDRLDAMVWAFRRLFWGARERNAGAAPIMITA